MLKGMTVNDLLELRLACQGALCFHEDHATSAELKLENQDRVRGLMGRIDGLLDEAVPGWQDAMPTAEAITSARVLVLIKPGETRQ